ncbi:hypothetical protein B296_00017379 [Ensete ventricosum]|uniref:GBF-interacting protein 1 N-terminal domain-containing protein n=1 Tax=Ensete ventricosum TaxID=4639 RepID=A0A427AZ36_ENSVE|nr:hypothetical protein B296_00017379 [Ensete ventricosum]
MSGGGGGGAGSRGNGAASAAPIPAGSRKLVQSLKEIVNCSETEIYAMLRECNMDPNEAVHRLLSQGACPAPPNPFKIPHFPLSLLAVSLSFSLLHEILRLGWHAFHEVRSKRDKKKECKFSAFVYVFAYEFHLCLLDYGASKGKLIHKKENGTSAVLFTASVLESSMISSNLPQKPAAPR